jgi:O-antigen ligase
VPGPTSPHSVRRPHRHIYVVVGSVAALAVVGLATSAPVRHAAAAVAHPRLTATSDDRVGESSAAIGEIANSPLLGDGPGTQPLRWSAQDGTVMFDRYAHDEYLQVAWKSGVVGLVLLLAMFAAFARRITCGRREAASHGLWAGSVAGLCGLAVASGLDFLWHVPVIPLVGVMLAGLCAPVPTEDADTLIAA